MQPPPPLLSGVLCAALVAVAPDALAQARRPPLREGTVVAIDNGDLVVDLGTSKGAYDGERVELWRPVKLRHPVTGQALVDRFRIGAVKLTQVQGTLSLAKLDGAPLRPVATGDVVVVPQPDEPATPRGAASASAPAPVAGSASASASASGSGAASGSGSSSDPDEEALVSLFDTLAGSPPGKRVRAYQSFLDEHPKSRFAPILREEIGLLRAASAPKVPAPYEVSERPPTRLRPGVPQRLAVELDPRLGGAVLQVRRKGAPAFHSIPMENVGPRYWAATLPGDVVAEPGTEYFVEGVPGTGRPVAVIGSAASPRSVEVDPVPTTGKHATTLAQVAIQSEYASFNAKRDNDAVFQTEASFGWRLRDEGLRAVRSGFGVLRGKGGTLEDLDVLGKPPKDVGLSYGWIEIELAPSTQYALIARPILGLREGGLAGGAQGFVRVGHDLHTNLVLGGEVLGQVGLRGIVQLEWRTIPRVPITLRTEVTNQPAGVGGDVGARAIAQVGYEIVRDLTVAARGSYQGRTIDHSGPGAGLAASYQW